MENLPTPLSRVELYLAKACGMDVTVPEQPESRLEQFLAVIAGDTSVELPVPAPLTELWLNFVAGGALTDEMELVGAYWIGAQKVDVRFFAVAGGMDGVELPVPQNRTELYWATIAETLPVHGVLKYATGTSITLTDVVRGITSLENVYGDTVQDGTPTPETPVDIEVVTGEQTVTITGKNLFDISKVLTQGTSLVNHDDGTLTITTSSGDSSVSAAAPNKLSDYCPNLKVGDTVTLSADSTGTQKRIYLSTAAQTWNFGASKTITQGMLNSTVLWYASGVSSTATISNIQVEYGSTPTDYQPYQSSDYEINLGKNLFSGNYSQFNNTGGTGTAYAYFKLPTDSYYTLTLIAKNDIEVQSPQKYIGFTRTGGSTTSPIKWAWNGSSSASAGDKIVVNNFPVNDTGLSYLSIYPKNEATLRWFVDNFDIQLEVGDNATSYAPYFEPIELCKIGNYQDYIYKNGDDWYLHKETNKVILDGSENWTSVSTFFYTTDITDYATSNNTPKSNFFTGQINTASAGGVLANRIAFNNLSGLSVPRFYIKYVDKFSTSSDLTTWLSDNRPAVYYAIATPVDTQITDSNLKAQLDALASARLPKPVAYLTVGATSPNLPASIKISYYGEEE